MNIRIIAVVSFAILLAPAAPAAAQQKPEVDPKAVEAITRVATKLRSLESFALDADVTTRAPAGTGQYRDFQGKVAYQVRRPAQLHASLAGKDLRREVYYDGAAATVYAPGKNLYARIPAAGTLQTFFDETKRRAGLEIPLAQLFAWDSESTVMSGATRAGFFGDSLVGGRTCRHYSYKKDGVAWEMYVDKDDLLCKLTMVDTKDKGLPGYSAELRWQVGKALDDAGFAFVPPAGAQEVSLEALHQAK